MTTPSSGVRAYLEPAPLAALFLGVSSGFAFSMIGATLSTRLAQNGVTRGEVTAFALPFLAYNFKFLWAPLVDEVRLPLIGRFGQRRSWLWLAGGLVMAGTAVRGLGAPCPRVSPMRGGRWGWCSSPPQCSASPAQRSTSSSTPTASSCSSRASWA